MFSPSRMDGVLWCWHYKRAIQRLPNISLKQMLHWIYKHWYVLHQTLMILNCYMLLRINYCWDITNGMKWFHIDFLFLGWMECFDVGIKRGPYRDCQISYWSKGVIGFTKTGILCKNKNSMLVSGYRVIRCLHHAIAILILSKYISLKQKFYLIYKRDRFFKVLMIVNGCILENFLSLRHKLVA